MHTSPYPEFAYSLPPADAAAFAAPPQAGEDEFARLFRRHFAPLVARAQRVLDCPHRAQEVVLDVFTKYWRQREAIGVHTSVEAYLKTSVSNRAIDYLRRRRRERLFAGELPLHRACPAARPDGLAQASQLAAEIRDAIAALPPRGREMFELNRFEGLTYQQIAERCGVSYKTVETHIRRALMALRNRLQPWTDREL